MRYERYNSKNMPQEKMEFLKEYVDNNSHLIDGESLQSSVSRGYNIMMAYDEANDNQWVGYALYNKIDYCSLNLVLEDLNQPELKNQYINYLNENCSDGNYIYSIEINKDLRGAGYGKEFYSHFEDKDVPTLIYADKDATGFWNKLGFESIENGDGQWMLNNGSEREKFEFNKDIVNAEIPNVVLDKSPIKEQLPDMYSLDYNGQKVNETGMLECERTKMLFFKEVYQEKMSQTDWSTLANNYVDAGNQDEFKSFFTNLPIEKELMLFLV